MRTETAINALIQRSGGTPQPEDYFGADGLLYCGKCNTPKQAFFEGHKRVPILGDRHPVECQCRRVEREKQEAIINEQKHLGLVHRLKSDGFSDTEMCNWTFANDNGRNPQMKHAHRYVDKWAEVRTKNIGLLLWGGVGTGKSFFAGCIANALMEQEVSVRMTNFASILNDLSNSFSGRNDMVDRLCSYPLLIIDARYRSKKPLIVTTILTLTDLKNPQDVAHARIYDRLLSMCSTKNGQYARSDEVDYLTENEDRHEKTGGTDEYQHSCQCERDPARGRRANRPRVSRIPQAFPAEPGTHGRVGGIPSRTPSEP